MSRNCPLDIDSPIEMWQSEPELNFEEVCGYVIPCQVIIGCLSCHMSQPDTFSERILCAQSSTVQVKHPEHNCNQLICNSNKCSSEVQYWEGNITDFDDGLVLIRLDLSSYLVVFHWYLDRFGFYSLQMACEQMFNILLSTWLVSSHITTLFMETPLLTQTSTGSL